MHFNTFSYFLFLPVVFLLHYFTPDKFRWLVLLMASFFFYAALKAPHLIAVLLLVTTITYLTGIRIDRKDDPETKKYLLWGGISANVLTLIILKYLPFITQNLNLLLKQIAPGTTVPACKAIIAIGVSYFIFQAISYLIDIYLEVEKPERHFGHFLLYMSFFPKLLQGPIERSGNLLPQFKVPYAFNYDNVRSGMLLFAIGLLKKVVIADRLAVIVNPVFDNVHTYKGFPLLLTTYCYSLQIYFDFSGYTDMALGTAMMFNISLTQNFNKPYFATSIADFWRRWHISFSRWILDYIFKPLQISWRDWHEWGTATALLITFTISGIWHGASWGFVIWGTLHGIYLASFVFYLKIRKPIFLAVGINEKSNFVRIASIIITFNLVSLAWLPFRLNKLDDVMYVIKNICSIDVQALYNLSIYDQITSKLNLTMGYSQDISLLLAIGIVTYIFTPHKLLSKEYDNINVCIRYVIYNLIVIQVLLALLVDTTSAQFIYLDF